MPTVHVSSKVTAVFTCSKCQRKKAADVSNYIKREKALWFNVKCHCGYGYTATLEKRQQHRKETDLQGTFTHFVAQKEVCRGSMRVCDLSLNGMRLKVGVEHSFKIEDLLQLEFQLDDHQKSIVKKKVIIRNINMPFLGTEFHSSEIIDKELGAFLFR
jgi:hypothetical protein